MSNSISKSPVTAKSVMNKLESLTKKAGDTTKNVFGDTIQGVSEVTYETLEYSDSNPFMTFLKYTLIFLAVGTIILLILSRLNILPQNLGDLFTYIRSLFHSSDRRVEVIEEPEKDAPYLVTSVENGKQRDDSDRIPNVGRVSEIAQEVPPTPLPQPDNPLPLPDDTGSNTQASQRKSGYCYIGEDRGFRSCIEVTESDTCMSGDIFPTQAICINPNFRQ